MVGLQIPTVVITFLMMWIPPSLMICWIIAMYETDRKKVIPLMLKYFGLCFLFFLIFFFILYLMSKDRGGIFWY